jgi:hypothetical protein
MSYIVRVIPASAPGSTLHFPGNGEGSYTSLAGTAALAAVFTQSGATLSGGAVVPGAAGDTGYCFTSDGYYAPYRVVTAGADGVIEVDIWRHGVIAQLGRVPAAGQTITFHTPASCIGTDLRPVIESIVVRTPAADTLTLTDAKGTAVEVVTIAATIPHGSILWEDDGSVRQGVFGFQFTTGTTVGLDIVFRGGRPTTKQSRNLLV